MNRDPETSFTGFQRMVGEERPAAPRRSKSSRRSNRQRESLRPEYQRESSKSSSLMVVDEALLEEEEEEEVYIVRQEYGYLSILFSVVQTIILGLMMWQCGVAPMSINPMIGPYPDALSEWGGKNSVLILDDGQWYRLVTPILLHAGVIHLLCNVAVQLETGVFFEREWGTLRWFIIYIGSALGSSILSVIMMPDAISVGSSGAVMGLFGGKLAEILMRACERTEDEQSKIGYQVRKEQCVVVTCSVTLVMLFSFIPYVDWAAHLGGLISGLVVGIGLFAWDMHLIGWQLFWFIVGAAMAFISFSTAFAHMYSGNVKASDALRDVCGYYQQQFEDYECNCMLEEYMSNLNMDGNSGD